MKTTFTLFSMLLLVATLNTWAQQPLDAVVPASAPVSLNKSLSPLRDVLLEKLKTKDKIKLDLFVMSQCPFGVRAEEVMLPMISELGEHVEFKLHFVGWLDQNQRIESMHGQAEVDENHRQVVIAKLYPALFSDYLLARAKNYQTDQWKSIAQPLGIEPEAVEKMMASQEGKQLLLEAIRPSMERKIYASPTVFIDDVKYQGRIIPLKTNKLASTEQCNNIPPITTQTGNLVNNQPITQTSGTVTTNSSPTDQCTGQSDGTPCDDGNKCTQNDACQSGVCVGTAKTCDDINACTIDSCDPATGCVFTPLNCNDNNACTIDACNPALGCTNTPLTPQQIDDNNACTRDYCTQSRGVLHEPIVCDDNNPNTRNSCDPIQGCISTTFCQVYPNNIAYVNASATGSNLGNSWTNAFTDLQNALFAAKNCGVTQIWVAKGTYYPTTITTDRNASFVMINGVAIYGGFPNDGSGTMANRNWVTNPTILSGEIQQDNDISNNSFHVIFNNNTAVNPLTNTAILDGFTITGGNANGSPPHHLGGGMYNYYSSPNLVNCSFSDNKAINNGSGMYNYRSSPSLMNCSFSGNQANYGGGMFNINASPNLVNCSFSGNKANSGGGIYNNDNSLPSLINCSFSGNQAQDGGGMTNYLYSSPSLVNCSFSGNQAYPGGGMANSLYSSPTLKNCILWGNSSEVSNDNNSPTYTNTLVKGLVVGGFQGTEDPLFVNQPPVGLGTTGDLRLQSCSPVLNAGNNAANTSTTDLDGNNRKFGVIDLGAYEYQANSVSKPTASASTTKPTVCFGANLALSASGGTTFSWNGPIGSNFSSTAQNPSPIASSTAFTGVYSVTVFKVNCSLTATATVSVSIQQAALSISPNPLTVCLGQTINLSANASPAASAFSWKGPGNFSSTTQNISTYATTTANLGIYSVSATIGSCTVSTFAEVKSGAILKAGVVGIPCVGGTIQFTATGMSSYTWSRTTNNFNSNLPNPVIPSSTMNDAGIYFLSARSGSCVASALVPVMLTGSGINPSFSVNPSAIAAGATVALSAASASGVYSWSGPSGFSGNTRTKSISNFQAVNNGVYRLTLTSGACSGYTEKNISINSATRLAAAETEPLDMEINAYPNPVTHTLTVEVRLKEPSALQLNLVNSVGKDRGAWQLEEISTFHKTELNLSALQGGVYLLQAQAGRQKVVKRVVKIQY
ncbi:MAG: T9SS type A sorting domain-containing protein [Spirosomataceae bacterium]